MIASLHIANFKAFAETQNVPIRPLTLIFGANSAGKSSILHSLILAHEALINGNLDPYLTKVGGNAVDLGGFRQYVHRCDPHNRVSLGFGLDTMRLKPELAEVFSSSQSIVLSVQIGLAQREITEPRVALKEGTMEIEWIEVPTGEFQASSEVRVHSFELLADGTTILKMTRRPDNRMQVDVINHEHPIVRRLLESLIFSFTTTTEIREADWKTLLLALADLVPQMSAEDKGFIPHGLKLEEESGWHFFRFVAISKATRTEDLKSALRLFLPKRLNDIVKGLYETIELELRSLIYLGPLRSYPSRFLYDSQENDPNWYAGGGHAWDLLLKDEKLRGRVNEWLSDASKLSTPYKLRVKRWLDLEDFMDALIRKTSGIELTRRQSYIAQLLEVLKMLQQRYGKDTLLPPEEEEKFKRLAYLLGTEWQESFPFESLEQIQKRVTSYADAFSFEYTVFDLIDQHLRTLAPIIATDVQGKEYLTLVDERTGTIVSHRDVGIGISQVLPVLVYSFAHQNKLIAIEQPEIHLHPALQAELGDVFIESALGERKNTFVLETHSEHLILRIMRRIRETTKGTLPEGLTPIKPEDVSVLYVEPDGSRSIVREMELNANGEFVKSWPGGFFEEGLRELFA